MNQPLQKILIVLIAGIGDFVLASKAIRSIRRGYPYAQIHLLTSSDAALLAQNYIYVDRVWAFPIREMKKSKWVLVDVLKMINRLRKNRFAVVINLYKVESRLGAVKMGLLFYLLGAEEKIGHDRFGFGCFLTRRIDADVFLNRHMADVMGEIALQGGGIGDNEKTEIFWSRHVEELWNDWIRLVSKNRPLIGINPGGDSELKRWNPDRFSSVAERLIDNWGANIVLLGGPSDVRITRRIADNMRIKPINLAGKLTLNDLAYLISRFRLLITNDSGPMHIAAATGTPVVAIFGPSDPNMFHPYMSSDRYRVIRSAVPCCPCEKSVCDTMKCLDLVTPDEVYEVAAELLHHFDQITAEPGGRIKRSSMFP